MRRVGHAACGTLLILALHAGSAYAQRSTPLQDTAPKSYPVISPEAYNRVLDILFPRDDPDPSKTVFELILRFRPSFQATSQIIIRRRVDEVKVVEYTSLDGNIYTKLNQALARGSKEDAVELAKSIRMKRREVTVPHTQVKRWFDTFFETLAATTQTLRERGEEFDKTRGSETIILDGTTYDLWYEQRLNKMSFRLYDADADASGAYADFKLVKWMNAVRLEIGKKK